MVLLTLVGLVLALVISWSQGWLVQDDAGWDDATSSSRLALACSLGGGKTERGSENV